MAESNQDAPSEEDRKLAAQLALALWIAQSGQDRPESADERRSEWQAKKGEFLPLATRTLRVLRRRGVHMELGSAKDVA